MQIKADLNWNEEAYIHQFRAGLSNEIKDMLIHHEYPDNLEGFALLTIRVDARLQEHRRERQLSTAWSNTFMSRGSEHNTRMRTNETVSQPMHMDVDATRRGPLTAQEREHRFKQRLCMVCGQAGHFKVNCPVATKRHTTSIATLSTSNMSSENHTSQ
ncbi:hypothetical protein BASA83_000316 [Batrachochytrium salamandrivorans]|nr:hypothetical protein BASA83_000316 [Batrachochytrium salamandrivorans]